MSDPLLGVNSLSKRYSKFIALEDISFSLERGEIIGLVGRRGAGKTSLLNSIGGVSPLTGGEIIFRGQPVNLTTPGAASRIGIELVHQMPPITEQLDILDNIFLGREICWPAGTRLGIPNLDEMQRQGAALLAEFDMPASLLHARTNTLSDEQRQIVAIARALCSHPGLVMFDDALDSLSFQRQQLLLDYLKRLTRDGVSVIISSDNLKPLFDVTNRILVLYEGRLAADRFTEHCNPRDIVELIVGSSSREQVTPIVWALESFHAAQRQTEELYRAQAALHSSLEASDSLNRLLVKQLSDQVKALDSLNAALQEAQRRFLTESEEERKALARDLHDLVIQDLLSFNYRLEETEGCLTSEDQREELDDIREGIRQVVSALRQVCQDLRPPTIDNHGLTSALRSLAQEWAERNNITLHLNIAPELGRLPEALELSVFRIVQEGLSNIRKHAEARNVTLTLFRTPMDNLLIRLSDDGKGLPTPPNLASLSASKHFGLLGISERAALLGGAMRVESPPEGGMILQIELPSPYPSA